VVSLWLVSYLLVLCYQKLKDLLKHVKGLDRLNSPNLMNIAGILLEWFKLKRFLELLCLVCLLFVLLFSFAYTVFLRNLVKCTCCFKVCLWIILYVLMLFYYYYVIKFISDLRQVGGFLRVLRFPPPIKLTSTI
jgi:hypothetical protein